MPDVHRKPIQVDESLIDIHQHVNNQEYLRWMQEIAIEHSTLQGWPMARYLQTGASWYVRSHFIEYLRPALLGDELLAHTWIAEMGKHSCQRRTLFMRASDRQILVRAKTQWIFVSLKNGRPIAVQEDVRNAFPVLATDEAALAACQSAKTASAT